MKQINYVSLLARVWPVLLASIVIGGAAGWALAQAMPEEYTAKSRSFVSTRTGASASDLLQGNDFSQGRVKSYADVVTSRAVLQPVAERLGISGGAKELSKHVTAKVPVDTVLIEVSVVDKSPEQAARLVNAITAQFTRVVSTLELPADPNGSSPVRISIVEGALPPSSPSSPNVKAYVAIGALLATLLAWLTLLGREVLSTRLRTSGEFTELTALPVLAELVENKAPQATRPANGHPSGSHAEAYRQLRVNLDYTRVDAPARCIVVTSAVQGEGKSTVAVNLAATIAEAGKTVAVVDGDLRRPSISAYLGLAAAPGLTSTLTSQTTLDEALQRWGSTSLHVLAAGAIPPNPGEFLDSQAMTDLLIELRERFDFVIVDAPPVLPVADAVILAAKADAVLYVARRGHVRTHEVANAQEKLAAVSSDVLGAVLNGSKRMRSSAYGYYGEYGAPSQSELVPGA